MSTKPCWCDGCVNGYHSGRTCRICGGKGFVYDTDWPKPCWHGYGSDHVPPGNKRSSSNHATGPTLSKSVLEALGRYLEAHNAVAEWHRSDPQLPECRDEVTSAIRGVAEAMLLQLVAKHGFHASAASSATLKELYDSLKDLPADPTERLAFVESFESQLLDLLRQHADPKDVVQLEANELIKLLERSAMFRDHAADIWMLMEEEHKMSCDLLIAAGWIK